MNRKLLEARLVAIDKEAAALTQSLGPAELRASDARDADSRAQDQLESALREERDTRPALVADGLTKQLEALDKRTDAAKLTAKNAADLYTGLAAKANGIRHDIGVLESEAIEIKAALLELDGLEAIDRYNCAAVEYAKASAVCRAICPKVSLLSWKWNQSQPREIRALIPSKGPVLLYSWDGKNNIEAYTNSMKGVSDVK